jgi:hypothetical protein
MPWSPVSIQSPTNFAFGGVRIAPVFEEHHRIRAADRDLALNARRQFVAVVVDDRDAVSGDRLAHGTGTHDSECRAGRQDEVALGLAVELVDRQAEIVAAPLERLAAERLAAGTEVRRSSS